MHYELIRRLLFKLDPELSHHFSLKTIKMLHQINCLRNPCDKIKMNPVNLWGLEFPNPVGLAAGLDKNGDYINALGSLGFGFIEIGTVTPKPQQGNSKPRLFRLVRDHAIINRMGFNNKGVDYLINQVKKKKYRGILGINIGKNALTPLEDALKDYSYCLSRVYPHASYVTVNISSPNTPGLRHLQGTAYLCHLLHGLKEEQSRLANHHHRYVPMLIKVSPDLSNQEIKTMAQAFIEYQVDGVIATNTTLDRPQLNEQELANEAGGLSGQPLFDKSTQVLKQFQTDLIQKGIPIIASGGILSHEQAKIKIDQGAKLIQLYTGLIFKGPGLILDCCKALND